jgi:hypothetical protein
MNVLNMMHFEASCPPLFWNESAISAIDTANVTPTGEQQQQPSLPPSSFGSHQKGGGVWASPMSSSPQPGWGTAMATAGHTSFYSTSHTMTTNNSMRRSPPRAPPVTRDGPPSEIFIVVKLETSSQMRYHPHLDDEDDVSVLMDDPDQEESESDEMDRLPEATYNVVTSLLAEDEDEDEEQLQQPKQAASSTQHSSVMRMMIETVFGDDEDFYPPAVMAAPTIPTWMMEQQPSPRNSSCESYPWMKNHNSVPLPSPVAPPTSHGTGWGTIPHSTMVGDPQQAPVAFVVGNHNYRTSVAQSTARRVSCDLTGNVVVSNDSAADYKIAPSTNPNYYNYQPSHIF